jgi:hypothetical protein
MRATLFLMLPILILMGSSCTSEKKSSVSTEEGKVTSLYVRFMEAENKVKAIVDFRQISGSPAGASEKDEQNYKVWFQGRAMQSLTEFTGKNYFDIELDYAKPGVFEFTVEDEKRQVNTYAVDLNLKSVIEIAGFKKGTGMMVDLKDFVLAEDDELIAVISDSASNSVSSSIKGPSKGKVLITQDAFNQLKEGPCTVYFVWKTTDQYTQENGRIIVREREYFFKEIKTELQK